MLVVELGQESMMNQSSEKIVGAVFGSLHPFSVFYGKGRCGENFPGLCDKRLLWRIEGNRCS